MFQVNEYIANTILSRGKDKGIKGIVPIPDIKAVTKQNQLPETGP